MKLGDDPQPVAAESIDDLLVAVDRDGEWGAEHRFSGLWWCGARSVAAQR
jgi:hypothetical protein